MISPRPPGGSRRAAPARAMLAAMVVLLCSTDSGAHTFVNRSEPRAGATLGESPANVRIWFDGPVERLFLKLHVEDGDNRRVDMHDGRVHPLDNTLVEARLSPLRPGRYRVFWGVVARDGHPREGTFSFLVK